MEKMVTLKLGFHRTGKKSVIDLILFIYFYPIKSKIYKCGMNAHFKTMY